MRKITYLSLLLVLMCALQLQGQQIQWASKVYEVSSQLKEDSHSSKEILGTPNTIYDYSDQSFAWAPNKENEPDNASIRVGFAKPMKIRQVAILESLHPGSIAQIILFYKNGKTAKIYENQFPRAALLSNRLFTHAFPLTKQAVISVEIRLRPSAVKGDPHLDAVAISDRRLPIKRSDIIKSSNQNIGAAINLGPMINSDYAEDFPVISPDGKTLYFSRNQHPQNMGEQNKKDIWVSYLKNDGNWTKAVNIGAPLNNKNDNAVIAVASTNDQLYLLNGNRGIATTSKKGRTWMRPRLLDIKDYYNDQEIGSYHIHLNGNVLLMALERKDSQGDLDLYVSHKNEDKTWSVPENLGNQINTTGKERSVFLASDGKTIYFSTDGLEGFGGLDLFMSRRLDETWTNWSEPINLGEQINSPLDDHSVSFPASGEYAYFSKEIKDGSFDLFRIRIPESFLPEPVAFVKGKIIDASTKRPIEATLQINNLDDDENGSELLTKKNGEYQMILPMGKNTGLVVEREGYFAVSESMELTDETLEGEDKDLQMTAQLGGSDAFISAETEKIRLRLNKLDSTLEQLNKKRLSEYKADRKFPFDEKSYQSDPELDALRHKYQLANHKSENSKSSISKPSKADNELAKMKEQYNKENGTKDFQTKGEDSDRDEELEDMKRRFNQYHNNKDEGKGDEEYLDMDQKDDGTLDEEDLYGYDPGFVALQEKTWSELMDQMEIEVRLELKKELINEVEKTTLKDLDKELDAASRFQLKKHALDISRELRKELRKINSEKTKLEKSKKISSIEKGLRKQMAPNIRKELRKEWKKIAQTELRAELEYRYRKDVEEDLRKELKTKERKEIKFENKNKYQPDLEPKSPNISAKAKDFSYQEVQKNILMIPIREEQILPMNNVFFETNTAKMKATSNAELRRVLKFLKENENLIVEISGHTNGWCSHDFANQISTDRAKAVREYFLDNKIPVERILAKGYGKTLPIATNETSVGRKQNQRIELKIIEID